ncbi:hypothetical protein BC830DRAFT_169325 [Chytriomyces sp. MP71]|nr:hypothetical protein BC830DRAFT_169325 [Chytriomyces sp. MP71]
MKAQNERDIPFAKAFKNLSTAIDELSKIAHAFLDSIDAYQLVLSEILHLHREHHDVLRRLAKHNVAFRKIRLKLDNARYMRQSNSGMDLVAISYGGKNKGKPKSKNVVDPEDIITGIEEIDLGPLNRAQQLLDQLLRAEQEKWAKIDEVRELKLVSSIHSIFVAQSELWSQCSRVFEKMKKICLHFVKAVDEANGGSVMSKKIMDFNVKSAKTAQQRRASITAQTNEAFFAKQQKLLIFQNPETNLDIAKRRLKLLKRWHHLSFMSSKLWLEIRDTEIDHVRSCIDWFSRCSDCHYLIQQYSSYNLSDIAKVDPASDSQKDCVVMLVSWGDAIRYQNSQTPMSFSNNLNLQKPLQVVQNCFQYMERTLFTINEKEKNAYDMVKKLSVMQGKTITAARQGTDLPPKSTVKGKEIQSYRPSPAAEALRLKLDKILIENRVFRRTKLIKCQAELWKGLSFCTKFMGTLYIYLASQHEGRMRASNLFSADDIKSNESDSASIVELDDAGRPEILLQQASLSETSLLPKRNTRSSLNNIIFLTKIIPDSEQMSESAEQLETLKSTKAHPLSSAKSSISALTRKPTSISHFVVGHAFAKVHPSNEGDEEFNGVSYQDETEMATLMNSLVEKINQSRRTSVKIQDEDDRQQAEHGYKSGHPLLMTDIPDELIQSSPAIGLVETPHISIIVDCESFTTSSVPPGTPIDVAEPKKNNSADLAIDKSGVPHVEPVSSSTEPKSAAGYEAVQPEASAKAKPQEPPANFNQPIQTVSATVDSEKKHQKRKKHRMKLQEKSTEPSAPPMDELNSISMEASDTVQRQEHRRRKRGSSHKKGKGPPPPPPINPGVVVSALTAPSLTISSASMTSTKLISIGYNDDELQETSASNKSQLRTIQTPSVTTNEANDLANNGTTSKEVFSTPAIVSDPEPLGDALKNLEPTLSRRSPSLETSSSQTINVAVTRPKSAAVPPNINVLPYLETSFVGMSDKNSSLHRSSLNLAGSLAKPVSRSIINLGQELSTSSKRTHESPTLGNTASSAKRSFINLLDIQSTNRSTLQIEPNGNRSSAASTRRSTLNLNETGNSPQTLVPTRALPSEGLYYRLPKADTHTPTHQPSNEVVNAAPQSGDRRKSNLLLFEDTNSNSAAAYTLHSRKSDKKPPPEPPLRGLLRVNDGGRVNLVKSRENLFQ